MSISFGTIRRRYDQGLDSIVRLVIQLEDRIEDLTAMQVAAPHRLPCGAGGGDQAVEANRC